MGRGGGERDERGQEHFSPPYLAFPTQEGQSCHFLFFLFFFLSKSCPDFEVPRSSKRLFALWLLLLLMMVATTRGGGRIFFLSQKKKRKKRKKPWGIIIKGASSTRRWWCRSMNMWPGRLATFVLCGFFFWFQEEAGEGEMY